LYFTVLWGRSAVAEFQIWCILTLDVLLHGPMAGRRSIRGTSGGNLNHVGCSNLTKYDTSSRKRTRPLKNVEAPGRNAGGFSFALSMLGQRWGKNCLKEGKPCNFLYLLARPRGIEPLTFGFVGVSNDVNGIARCSPMVDIVGKELNRRGNIFYGVTPCFLLSGAQKVHRT